MASLLPLAPTRHLKQGWSTRNCLKGIRFRRRGFYLCRKWRRKIHFTNILLAPSDQGTLRAGTTKNLSVRKRHDIARVFDPKMEQSCLTIEENMATERRGQKRGWLGAKEKDRIQFKKPERVEYWP